CKIMKAINIFSVANVPIMLSFCGSNGTRSESARVNEKGFAVIAVFTSVGCSSCPPANVTIIKFANEFPERVYVLRYHVDYCDYDVWKDEFEYAEYTKRQDKYVVRLNLNSSYTPQVILNGKKEIIGSRENQLRTAIQEELKDSTMEPVAINLVGTPIKEGGVA